MTKFLTCPNQSICRQQNNSDSKLKFVSGRLKIEICVGKNRKRGKMTNCWLPAISLFPTMFLKAFFSGDVKSRDCGNGLNLYYANLTFNTLKIYSCGKHCEKRRNCL